MIPEPVAVRSKPGSFSLRGRIGCRIAPELRSVTKTHFSFLEEICGAALVPDAEKAGFRIHAPDSALGEEEYRLRISPDGIDLECGGAAGCGWGLSTLVQLAAAGGGELKAREIEDYPAYRWRGLHLDVGRHFFGVDRILRLLDLMSLFRFNRFHWHLTEDQGWRIETDGFPELVTHGAWRTEPDGSRYGGYYSRGEIARVVDHAAELGISVLPEIELPGHAQAVTATYPALSCSGRPVEVWNGWGVSEEVFCAGKEETFAFLEGVLTGTAELFPFPLFHIGGDECPKTHWKECPDCRRRMQEEGLGNEEELQSYFIRRAQAVLKRAGKEIIGWDEILEGGLAPGAAVMSWRGTEGGIEAARAGHDVVMCPERYCYLDHRQTLSPQALGPTHFDPPPLLLREVYGFDPAEGVPPEYRDRILGGQANVWTEAIDSWERAEHMIFPRALAMAETLWRGEARNWNDFQRRLPDARALLDAFEVAYCPDPAAWGDSGS